VPLVEVLLAEVLLPVLLVLPVLPDQMPPDWIAVLAAKVAVLKTVKAAVAAAAVFKTFSTYR